MEASYLTYSRKETQGHECITPSSPNLIDKIASKTTSALVDFYAPNLISVQSCGLKKVVSGNMNLFIPWQTTLHFLYTSLPRYSDLQEALLLKKVSPCGECLDSSEFHVQPGTLMCSFSPSFLKSSIPSLFDVQLHDL